MRLMLLSLLAALAAAENQTTGVPFQVRASAPGTPVDNRMMTASNLTFFLNGQTASTCPLSSGCPPGNRTVLNGDASSLDVLVPGGQQIFVTGDGAVHFTPAHSPSIPPGASTGPFSQAGGAWHFTGLGARDFMACPTSVNRWRVFAALRNATVPGVNVTACVPFVATVIPFVSSQPGAFQYT
ncbi:hypothetical protein CNMCM6936_005506 [Aspergillus lentulus]|uniref:IgE binding protein n=1 Tax=Aspergillus lentulus TaxID=293939 RepID=A0AAN6BQ16_ASPLE|nr:hypothetical protein CNMCM6069_008375 [Aspergillus lentulus]KAF4167256.1 hypothetical protein CNMCM6936_005506 [Aspergillus lentulus]KAF4173870.1 hypothetical protein CNMCM8060_009418 [Aspergillus lentulus]KAF4184700.1 hypothetical protein CNMCM7927_007642 [Aspergillus lentulus]KAF4193395.1 hypothetical protein CNMCM8694_008923 [Aspergillus lentulus]